MKPLKRVLGSLRKADEDFGMIQDGDKIAVGLSGGKDSSALLYCINLYKRFSKKQYEVMAIYVDLGFGQTGMDEVTEYFRKLGVEVKTIPSDVCEILKLHADANGHMECSLCSQLRKGALISEAKKLGCNKIAFGHHSDDAVETLFMNMIHGGRIATFNPNMFMSRSKVYLLRPLIYAYENDIRRMVSELEIPISHNPCPNNGVSERQEIKDMLHELYRKHPEAKNNFQLMLRNQKQLSILKPIEKAPE
ncbi:MAG: tRNA 2-thiocytidine(32) synthetase TtcA [Erysipelotrichaceae bacterium]|nr:tRNA 2-thiocytidine(32) synthetase TtcA [Erysipelotrichaceae bacterium]